MLNAVAGVNMQYRGRLYVNSTPKVLTVAARAHAELIEHGQRAAEAIAHVAAAITCRR